MKYLFRILLVILIAGVLPACSSNGSNDDDKGFGSGKMTANIGGTAWNAASATATEVSIAGFSTLTIAGSDTGAKSMTVSFAGLTRGETGTFSLGSSNNLASMSYIADATGTTYIATSGSASISSYNDSGVKGTFSFEGTVIGTGTTLSITNGTFEVGYGPSIF